jgi:hypothetical protein
MFNLRSGLKAEWIDTDLLDNTAGWRSEWSTLRTKFQVFRGEVAISQ